MMKELFQAGLGELQRFNAGLELCDSHLSHIDGIDIVGIHQRDWLRKFVERRKSPVKSQLIRAQGKGF
jgi:phosphate starvation-inducible protein PhoH